MKGHWILRIAANNWNFYVTETIGKVSSSSIRTHLYVQIPIEKDIIIDFYTK